MAKRTTLTPEHVVERFPNGLELKEGRVVVQSRPRRPKTNVEFVRDLMEFSRYGALAQVFVIDALDKWSKKISECDPAQVNSAMINGEAWVGVAKEIQEKINARS